MEAPDEADDDRCRGFGRGTSSSPFEREELRLLFPTMMATSREVGGANEVDDEERDVGDDSDEEVDVLDMVGARVGVVCLCIRKGY